MAEFWNKLCQIPEGAPLPVPPLGWIGIGFAVGLVLSLIAWGIAALLRRRKGRKMRKSSPDPWDIGNVAVEKLHRQGARKSQQDCFSVSNDSLRQSRGLLAVVADGMGGLSDGDKVSQAAVTAMMNGFYQVQGSPEHVLLALLALANQAVNQFLGPEGLYNGGSTLVAGLIRDGAFHFLSVGDSCVFLFRDGALIRLNRAHVFRNELYLRAVNGEISFQEAAEHPKAPGLTSFLGMGQLKYVDLPAQSIPIRPGDKYVLMSDGVYNALTPRELTQALSRDGGAAEALEALIESKGYPDQDNYTAVILAC